MVEDLQYFEDKIERLYDEILTYLEIDINGNSLLINNEKFLKEYILRSMSIGYNRYSKNFAGKHKNAKNSVSIIQFTKAGVKVKEHASVRAAERAVGLSHGAIHGALKRNSKSGGYIWMKKADYEMK